MLNNLYLREVYIKHKIPTENYLSHLPSVVFLNKKPLTFSTPVTFLVGENGMGKSTLIEAIAIALGFNPEGGSKNFNFSTEDSHSDLFKYLGLVRGVSHPKDGYFLRAESFYNVATEIDRLDLIPAMQPPVIEGYGGVSLHRQSHGESFMALAENRFQGNGIYILDEPEAALSPMKLMRLMERIHQLTKLNSQFIISTHSPILMAYPGARIYEITPQCIRETTYRETDHFRITKQFLEDPERVLYYLFNEKENEE